MRSERPPLLSWLFGVLLPPPALPLRDGNDGPASIRRDRGERRACQRGRSVRARRDGPLQSIRLPC